MVYCLQFLKLPAHISSARPKTSILNNSHHLSISLSRLTAACSARIPSWTLSRRHPRRSCLWWQCLRVSRRRQSEKKCVSHLSLEGLEWRSLTGMLPFTADLALSVKLWPPWAPVESPVLVSGMVLSVEAIAFVLGPVLVWVSGFEIDLLERVVVMSASWDSDGQYRNQKFCCNLVTRQRHDVKYVEVTHA